MKLTATQHIISQANLKKDIARYAARAEYLKDSTNLVIYMVLAKLQESNPDGIQIRMSDLSRITHKTYQTLLKHVKELEEMGAISRLPKAPGPTPTTWIVNPLPVTQ